MIIETDNRGNYAILMLSEKFSIEDIPTFDTSINSLLQQKIPGIVCDLNELRVIDSSGIGALVKAINRAKNNNTLFILVRVNETIMNIFKISHLEKFLPIYTPEELSIKYSMSI